MDRLAEIKALAEDAVKGAGRAEVRMVKPEMGGNHQMHGSIIYEDGRRVHVGGWRERTSPGMGAFVKLLAALDPDTVLGLITALENARNEALEEAAQCVEKQKGVYPFLFKEPKP